MHLSLFVLQPPLSIGVNVKNGGCRTSLSDVPVDIKTVLVVILRWSFNKNPRTNLGNVTNRDELQFNISIQCFFNKTPRKAIMLLWKPS